jgi:putative ABC transport system substrate-binding protein
MHRREFITFLGGAAATWPIAVRAQQPAIPVIGFLSSQSLGAYADLLRGFHQGLKETGYVEGENVAIEYAWADNQIDRLSVLAAELVRRQVAVIVASGLPASESAIKATTTIPIVFMVPADPVKLGFVASLARPTGNATGIHFFVAELAAKRLEILRELVPGAARVAVLINPAEAAIAAANLRGVEMAAHAMGLKIQVLNASTSSEIDAAFATFVRERFDAFFISSGVFFLARRIQLATLAISHGVPAIFATRDWAEAGGLVSYGTNLEDTHRQAGIYAGRILKGAKPADLPVMQSTKFELVINLKTAKTLGLKVPQTLLVAADEVIE